MSLTSGGRTALWIGGGGFIGLAIGALLVDPDRAFELSPMWLIAFAVYVGVVLGIARRKPEPGEVGASRSAASAPRPHLAPASPEALSIRFEFPDVPAGYPAVLGRGEPLHVSVKVIQASQPAEGAGVQLTASLGGETLKGDGITGTTGEVEFTLEPEGTGELVLAAQATAGTHAGRGSISASIVEYDVEIERLFGEFRAYAVGVLGPEAHADTARELCDKLRTRAAPDTARALLELARVYELVAYGEREADRRLYLSVLEQLMVIEQAELTDPTLARSA